MAAPRVSKTAFFREPAGQYQHNGSFSAGSPPHQGIFSRLAMLASLNAHQIDGRYSMPPQQPRDHHHQQSLADQQAPDYPVFQPKQKTHHNQYAQWLGQIDQDGCECGLTGKMDRRLMAPRCQHAQRFHNCGITWHRLRFPEDQP